MPAPPPRPGRAGSFAFVAGVYALAVAAAWLVFHVAPVPPQGAMVLGLLAATAVTFAATRYADNGSVFDAWWSVLPPVVALWATGLAADTGLSPRQVAVHAVVWFWAVRLTLNWAVSWPGLDHEDWRYTQLYAEQPLPRWAVQLLPIELFPTLVVAAGCLPLVPALTAGDWSFGWLEGVALAVGLGATALELAADEQMRAFGFHKEPGQVMDRGLWRYSRHPNYLGEILFWVSLWLFAVAATPDAWWTGIGALVMIGLFVFASIPMLDRRSRERRPGFEAYARRTSALVPWPPRAGGEEKS